MKIKYVNSIKTKPAMLFSVLVVLVLLLSACQPAVNQPPAQSSTQAPAPTSAPAEAATATVELPSTGATAAPATGSDSATINVATDPELGKILVDGKGMTLYMFAKDGPSQSNCSGKCLANWPALKTEGNPTLGEGVDSSLIGSATLSDGSLIVTYNKMPLYTFVKDKNAGDVNGQGSNDVWYVVAPDGKPVGYTMPGAEAPSSATEATVKIATDPKLGKILVDGKGMTLYMYAKDGPNQSNCSGQCIENWPALKTEGKPTLGEGVDSSLVGTAKLADGSLVVTYNGMPLYTFVKDKNPGDVNGQGSFDVWYVVAPDGNPVGYTLPSSAAPTEMPAPTAKPDY